jgi:ATP-dependent RNA helicase DeaD
MVRLLIDSGRRHGVRPADIVGAIANEAGVPGQAIGAIDIDDYFSTVELSQQYQAQVLKRMARAMIRNRPLRISVASPASGKPRRAGPRRKS